MSSSQRNPPAVLLPFLDHWFSGFNEGLEQLNPAGREVLLRACGRACARSYTLSAYQEAWELSQDLESFLSRLGDRFRGAEYRLVDDKCIEVKYHQCTCDLVTSAWVQTPAICQCSAYNLEANFRGAMGVSVSVQMDASLLAGAPYCKFLVRIEQ